MDRQISVTEQINELLGICFTQDEVRADLRILERPELIIDGDLDLSFYQLSNCYIKSLPAKLVVSGTLVLTGQSKIKNIKEVVIIANAIRLDSMKLTELPDLTQNYRIEYLDVSNNRLRNLIKAPSVISGTALFSHNNFKDLRGFPELIRGDIFIDGQFHVPYGSTIFGRVYREFGHHHTNIYLSIYIVMLFFFFYFVGFLQLSHYSK